MKGTRTTHASKAHWLFWKGSLETAEREFLFAEPVWKTFIREKSHYAVMRIFHLLYFCEGKHVPQQEAKTTLFNVNSNINFSSLNHLNANFIIKHNTMQPVLNPLTCYSQMEPSIWASSSKSCRKYYGLRSRPYSQMGLVRNSWKKCPVCKVLNKCNGSSNSFSNCYV